jgi:hypothetical protein
MSSITSAELAARFLAEERALDARARALVEQRRSGRSIATPAASEPSPPAGGGAVRSVPKRDAPPAD